MDGNLLSKEVWQSMIRWASRVGEPFYANLYACHLALLNSIFFLFFFTKPVLKSPLIVPAQGHGGR